MLTSIIVMAVMLVMLFVPNHVAGFAAIGRTWSRALLRFPSRRGFMKTTFQQTAGTGQSTNFQLKEPITIFSTTICSKEDLQRLAREAEPKVREMERATMEEIERISAANMLRRGELDRRTTVISLEDEARLQQDVENTVMGTQLQAYRMPMCCQRRSTYGNQCRHSPHQ